MGLVTCIDCGQSVSDRLTVCPHCGGPIEVIEESYESQTFEEETHLNDDGEKEVRDPNLVESPEIDPEIYLQLTPNQLKRVEETPSKQQKKLIDSFLKQNNPEIRNKTQKKKKPKELDSLSPSFAKQALNVLGAIGLFVVLWRVGFAEWFSDWTAGHLNNILESLNP